MNPLRLIPAGFRKNGVVVIVSILFRAILDLAGIAALVPVLILAANPDAISQNNYLSALYEMSGLESHTRFIVAVCMAVFVFILVKGLINIAISQYTSNYILSLYRFYSGRLFDSYHKKGLLFLKSRNSAKLAYEVNYVCMAFVQGVLSPIAAMICDATMLVLMFGAMIVYDYRVALMLILLFVPVTFIYIYLIRGKIQNYGQQENEIRRNQNRTVIEVFKGYAEIEINDGFPKFYDRFENGLRRIATLRRKYMLVQQIPSLLIELCIVAVLSAMVLLKTDVVLLGIFAIAAIKVLPSIKNMIGGWITIKNNRYCEQIIADGLEVDNRNPEERDIVFDRGICVENVSFAFPDDDKTVLRDFSMTIRKGECIGIRGVSGGGKTTLFNLLLGFYSPQNGRILIDGTPLSASNRRAWQNLTGYVPQEVFITDGTIMDNIALGDNSPDRGRIMQALEAAKLSDFVNSLSSGIDTPIGECGSRLSGGQKQRIGIARALYKGAQILFFDEATSSLDSDTEKDINDSITSLTASADRITIIIIAHRESSLTICDRIITV